jgi:exodeoxyribonuclease VII large subunit
MPSLFDLPFDAGDEPPSADVRPDRPAVYTVSELTADVRVALESGFGELAVEGELSNCRAWRTGHLYFTLKDEGAQLRAVMFRSAARLLKFQPEDGQHVVARGRLGVYEAKGEYQLICDVLEPRGLGALQLAFEQLRRRLAAEGLFDPARKRALPLLPRRIGVVTSLDGAALRDILSVLSRRYPNAQVVIRPARVQGEGAADEIARALAAVTRVEGVDVVIVGRGGGSIEDLWAFNEEVVARAIASSPVPIISAVGHETDTTIADFAADLRAPTPSAAAETVVARKDEFVGRIDRQAERLRAALAGRVMGARGRVHALESRRGLARVPATIAMRGRHVAELGQAGRHLLADRLSRASRRLVTLDRELARNDPRRRLATSRGRLEMSTARLDAATRARHARAHAAFGRLAGQLDSLSPLAVLGRGYAVCWDDSRTRIIRHAGDVTLGDQVRVTLGDGELGCVVRTTRDGRQATSDERRATSDE